MQMPTGRSDWKLPLLGVCLVILAWRNLANGTSLFGHKTVSRSEDPALFWCSVCLEGAVGIGCLALYFLGLLSGR